MNFQPSPLSSLDPLDPTPIQLLLKAPVTTAGYCGFSDPSGKITTGFLIHEEEKFIAGLPKDISVELRGKIFTQDQPAVLVIMLGIGKEIYETWWNYWAGQAISDRFGDLSVQKDIPVILFGQSMTPRRVIWVNNSLRNIFQDFNRQFQSAPFWTMDAFEAARNQIYKQ
jgi:hypothetical protein